MLLANRIKKAKLAAGGGGGGVDVPTDGLIAHYTMDNISENTLVDETGNYSGTISGATQVAGRFGQALYFDGSDRVDISNIPNAFTAITISAWIKSTQSGGTSGLVFGHRDNGGSGLIQFRGAPECGVTYRNASGSSGVRTTGYNTLTNDGFYHHVVLTMVDNEVIVYVDNVVDAQNTTAFTCSFNETLSSIGDQPTNGSEKYTGDVDQYRIYNRALTAAEVNDLYNEAI